VFEKENISTSIIGKIVFGEQYWLTTFQYMTITPILQSTKANLHNVGLF